MEKQSVLSKLKNKYLLIGLALISPLLLMAGGKQVAQTAVKGISISATVASTQTLAPTLIPTDTPTPTVIPTNTPIPTRVYIAPTKVYTPPTLAPPAQTNSQLDNNKVYTNSEGNTVHSLANTVDGSVPAGASARCGDGTYSFSQSRRGTCSHHGGVAQWL